MQWTVAIGVDTHKDVHVAVALDALGAQLESREIATTPAGHRSLLFWAQELGLPAFAVEGRGSYGAGLVRFLERAGVSVYECERPRRQERRRGKSDLIDAALAARKLLGRERLHPAPRLWSARGSVLARASQRRAGTDRRPQPAEPAPGHRPLRGAPRSRLGGHVRGPAGRIRSTKPRNWRSEEIPIAAWQRASGTSSASETFAGRPVRGGTGYSSAKT
jgi:transposase